MWFGVFVVVLVTGLYRGLLHLFKEKTAALPNEITLFLGGSILGGLSRSLRVVVMANAGNGAAATQVVRGTLLETNGDYFLGHSNTGLVANVAATFLVGYSLHNEFGTRCTIIRYSRGTLGGTDLCFGTSYLIMAGIFHSRLSECNRISSALTTITTNTQGVPGTGLILGTSSPISFSLSGRYMGFTSFNVSGGLGLNKGNRDRFYPIYHRGLRCSSHACYRLKGCTYGGYNCQEVGPSIYTSRVFLGNRGNDFIFFSSFNERTVVGVGINNVCGTCGTLTTIYTLRVINIGVRATITSLSSFNNMFNETRAFNNARVLLIGGPTNFARAVGCLDSYSIRGLVFILGSGSTSNGSIS